jgi:hypothetical protein
MSQFGNEVYEITKIDRTTGLLEADSLRIGRRYIPTIVVPERSATLVHADDYDKVLVTSRVKNVVTTKHIDGRKTLIIVTKHTTYTLEQVTL